MGEAIAENIAPRIEIQKEKILKSEWCFPEIKNK